MDVIHSTRWQGSVGRRFEAFMYIYISDFTGCARRQPSWLKHRCNSFTHRDCLKPYQASGRQAVSGTGRKSS